MKIKLYSLTTIAGYFGAIGAEVTAAVFLVLALFAGGSWGLFWLWVGAAVALQIVARVSSKHVLRHHSLA